MATSYEADQEQGQEDDKQEPSNLRSRAGNPEESQ
jgi:hypothetical protein